MQLHIQIMSSYLRIPKCGAILNRHVNFGIVDVHFPRFEHKHRHMRILGQPTGECEASGLISRRF